MNIKKNKGEGNYLFKDKKGEGSYLFKDKKAQVWIETAIYTLIGLTIIAILLTSAKPQIEKIKDRGIIGQTAEAMNLLDNEILEVEQAPSAIREVRFNIAKGKLEINATSNSIQYVLEDTRYKLSEPDKIIQEGEIFVLTKERGSRFDVYLTMNYTDRLNMTFNGEKKTEILQPGTTPYRIIIENVGDNLPTQNTHIDFRLL